MGTATPAGFAVAGLLTLLTVPLVRWIALRTWFVDQPATRKVHVRPIPYLGGVAIMVGTLGGIAAGSNTTDDGLVQLRFAAFLLLATLIGLLGLADDAWALSPRLRLALQVLAAAAAVALGVRLEVTGIGPLDAALAVVWIVGITNAVNLLDNMDGLSAAIAGVAAAGCAVIGVAASLPVVALCGAAIAGATCGYLAYNIRPALIFMGDAGAVFLGFLLAVLVARASAATTTTGAATVVVAVGLLAIPLLDTATVTISRLRHGISVTQGGKDHLSHRLVARGLPPGLAVAALALTGAATAGAAIGVATSSLRPALGLALVVAAAGPVAWTTWRVPVAPHGSGLAAVPRAAATAGDARRTADPATLDGA